MFVSVFSALLVNGKDTLRVYTFLRSTESYKLLPLPCPYRFLRSAFDTTLNTNQLQDHITIGTQYFGDFECRMVSRA